MKVVIPLSAIPILLLILLPSSYNKSVDVVEQESLQSPYPDEEAELMALWYGGELIADSMLYLKFDDALQLLRSTHAESIPQVSIPFEFPYTISKITIGLTDSAALAYQAGDFNEWDSLNMLLGIKRIDTSMFFHMSHLLTITFNGRLHPERIVERYEPLNGVSYVHACAPAGDWPNTYPWIVDDCVTFLVREAWGDCPTGCGSSHFFYFKEFESGIKLIGDWESGTPLPDWWEEGRIAFCVYKNISKGLCSGM
jgi:hypothetical protein